MEAAMKQQSPPTPKTLQETLEQRIVSMLANTDAGNSDDIFGLMAEVEAAITLADHDIAALRAKSVDITSDPDVAHQGIVDAEAAKLARDRLHGAVPKLRDKLTAALRSEERERWLSDFSSVRQQRDDAVSLFRDYPQHAKMIAQMFALAEQADKEVSRINGSAPDGEHRRLRSVELEARDLDGFTINNPSLASTVELRDWENAGRKLWPCTPSLAAQYAALSVAVPYHPGALWSDPEVQAQRRAEKEKQNREIGEHYQRMTAEQEDRINREERERVQKHRRV
jgi:hypothetical protein